MSVEVMFVALAGIAAGIWVIRAGMRHEERKLGLKAGLHGDRDDAVTKQLGVEVERLRERVAVLEKLVTDDDRKLAAEIDGLKRQSEARG